MGRYDWSVLIGGAFMLIIGMLSAMGAGLIVAWALVALGIL